MLHVYIEQDKKEGHDLEVNDYVYINLNNLPTFYFRTRLINHKYLSVCVAKGFRT